jgi:hypothetical protein
MSSNENGLHRHKTRRRVRRSVVVLFVLLAGLTVLVLVAWMTGGGRDLEILFEQIHAKGEPVTREELRAWRPNVSDDRNAALKLLEWAKQCPTPTTNSERLLDYRSLPVRTGALNEIQRTAIDEFVTANAECIQQLHEILQLDDAVYPGESLGASIDGHMPEEALLERADSMFYRDAFDAIDRHDADRALTRAADLLRLAHTLRNEPDLGYARERRAIQRGAVHMLVRTLNYCHSSDDALAAVDRALAMERDPNAYYRTLIGERVALFEHFNDVEHGPSILTTAITCKPLLQTWTKMVDASRLPVPERQTTMSQIEREFVQFYNSDFLFNGLLDGNTFRMAIARSRDYKAFDSDTVRLDLARATIAVARFRIKYGSLPQTLHELVPEFIEAVPVDPFSAQQEIVYKPSENSFLVYSFGNNWKDDGGNLSSSKRSELDIVIAVEPQAKDDAETVQIPVEK